MKRTACLEVFLDRGIRETAALDKQSLEYEVRAAT
jgi:hypothetical protein